jgi:serine/threonine protein kinase
MRVVFPCYTEFPVVGGVNKFTYRKRLTDERSASAVFEAILDSPDDMKGNRVVVKFVRRYSPEAHHLLADSSLAPRLLHHELIPNTGIHFVVMEHIKAKEVGEDYLKVRENMESLRKALEKLHEEGFVFGDLREPNILIAEGSGDLKLVDFDWCGKAGEVRYPVNINKEIEWPGAVVGGEKIELEHDRAWFKALTGSPWEQ